MTKLLFVCGFPGGGTDLTKTILNAHPNIQISGEMPFLKDLSRYGYHARTTFTTRQQIQPFQALLQRLDIWQNIVNLDADFGPALATSGDISLEEALRTMFTHEAIEVWGNKTPQNTENIPTLAQLFPTAYYLFVVRDVRDICLSWQRKWGKDMIWCAHKWAHRMRIGRVAVQELDPQCYLFIRFEDLLASVEECCRQICTFLQIPFSERMLEHHKYTREAIDGKLNYGNAIVTTNQQKWRNEISPGLCRRIEEIAFDTMQDFGYSPAFATQPRPISTLELLRATAHDLYAMLFVGNRASRRNSVQRRLESVRIELFKRLRV